MDDLTSRAMRAYFRSHAGTVTDQPANTSGMQEHNGRQYVVLHNVKGVLAVYRVRNGGQLKGLKRWPTELESAAA